MATITRAAFALSWTTSYSALLTSPEARLTTRAGYTAAGQDPRLGLPWEGLTHPSWFWSRYLASRGRIRNITADAAFDRVVPFRWLHGRTFSGPPGTEAEADAFLYPSAVSVVFRVTAEGEWPLDGFAAGLDALRSAKTWGVKGKAANRNLDGLAGDLGDEAAKLLSDGAAPAADYEAEPLTVAAPLAGKGDAAAFDLKDETVRSCLAGLAALGPPGAFNEKRLLDANTNTKLGSRVYAIRTGHAIWHPGSIREPPAEDPIGCLLHNQTTLVTHVDALLRIALWANDRLDAGGAVPGEVLPLVRNAVLRLHLLHGGRVDKTYRSGIAKERIAEKLETLQAVSAAL